MNKMITLLKDYFKDLVEGYKTPLDMDNWSKFYKKHWKGALVCIIAGIGGMLASVSVMLRQQSLKTKAKAWDELYEEYVDEKAPKRIKDYSMKEGRRHEA